MEVTNIDEHYNNTNFKRNRCYRFRKNLYKHVFGVFYSVLVKGFTPKGLGHQSSSCDCELFALLRSLVVLVSCFHLWFDCLMYVLEIRWNFYFLFNFHLFDFVASEFI